MRLSKLNSGCMVKGKMKIIAVLCISALIIAFVNREMKASDKMSFHVSIKSSTSGIAQVFYDSGKGFSESDSARFPVKASEAFIELKFPLPGSIVIRSLRFDPIDKEGTIWLKNIALFDGLGRRIIQIQPNDVIPLNDIADSRFENGAIVITTLKNATDPITAFSITYPIANESLFAQIIKSQVGLFLASFLGVLSAFSVLYLLSGKTLTKFMNIFGRSSLINASIALFSTVFAVAMCYLLYSYYIKHVGRTAESVLDAERINENYDYTLSFYNRKGKRITEKDGVLKLVTDPFTVYKNYPNQQCPSYSIDARGFRAGQTTNIKASLAFLVGGSAAFGYGLNDSGKTFASILDKQIAGVKVLNAAVVGFCSGQELSQMIHYLDNLNPNLYIVFDSFNDVMEPFVYAHDWPVIAAPIGFNNTFVLIEDRLATLAGQQTGANGKDNFLKAAVESFNENSYLQDVIDTYISNIDKMHAFARARGAIFLLAFQPEVAAKKNKTMNELEILSNWDRYCGYLQKDIPGKLKSLRQKTKRHCQLNNIEVIDINEVSSFIENPQTLFYDAVHPNELGHYMIAEILRSRVEQLTALLQ